MANRLRLEYHDYNKNSHKYYEMSEVGSKTGKVLVHWGRVGKAGDEIIYDYDVAQKKLSEKLKKGYEIVSGQEF